MEILVTLPPYLARLPSATQRSDEFSQCLPVIELFKKQLPTFHTRAMKKALFEKFGRIAASLKPAHLR